MRRGLGSRRDGGPGRRVRRVWPRTTTGSAAARLTSRSSASLALATVLGRALRPLLTRLAASSGACLDGWWRRRERAARAQTVATATVRTRTFEHTPRPLCPGKPPGPPGLSPARSRCRPAPPWRPRRLSNRGARGEQQQVSQWVAIAASWGAQRCSVGVCRAPKSRSGCVVPS